MNKRQTKKMRKKFTQMLLAFGAQLEGAMFASIATCIDRAKQKMAASEARFFGERPSA